MGVWRVWRSWLGVGCGLLWAGVVGMAAGQSIEMRPVQRLLPGALPTVSVATLQVPAKAWTHFERARDAMQANRTEEFERETAKALEVAPNFAAVYLLRAIQEVSGPQFDAAIAAWSRRSGSSRVWRGRA
jgi:hypothetical protein